MSSVVSIDLTSATPPYDQIRSQISALVRVGSLAPGDRLPTVRGLAADLGVAAGTVARAYKELEAAGLVESRRRLGTVVAAPPAGIEPAADSVRPNPEVTAAVVNAVRAARTAGMTDDHLLELVRAHQAQPH